MARMQPRLTSVGEPHIPSIGILDARSGIKTAIVLFCLNLVLGTVIELCAQGRHKDEPDKERCNGDIQCQRIQPPAARSATPCRAGDKSAASRSTTSGGAGDQPRN